MDVEFFGIVYVTVLICGTGVMQIVGIVLAIKTWLIEEEPTPSLGVRESLLSPNDDDNEQMHGRQHSSSNTCEV